VLDRDEVSRLVNHDNGVEGRVDHIDFRLGNAAFAGVENHETQGGNSQIWLADQTGGSARCELDDGLRQEATEAISNLKSKGYTLSILSGDRRQAVESIARRTGISTWYAGQTPKMKMEYLESLQAQGKSVLMVGDGVNDAPVLSVANVSMTVKGASELANSTADFILTGISLNNIPNILCIGDKTQAVIRQNLTWALAYNLLAVPFAAAGLIVPWMAALGMSVSSLMVVLNSGRLAKRESQPTLAFEQEVSTA
jgi:Cu2+-exporting ATPase